MERARLLTLGERGLALLLLAGALGLAALENRSTVAGAIRDGRPWSCWLALDAPGVSLPQLFLAYYVPSARSLDLIYVPQTLKLPDGGTLARAYAAAKKEGASDRDAARAMADAAQALVEPTPHFFRGTLAPGTDEPPVAAKRWLAGKTRGGAFWGSMLTGRNGNGLERFEMFRIGLELHQMDEDHLRAAYLPGPEEIPSYFAALRGDSKADERGETRSIREVTVEVLNATSKPGVANRVTKVLRSRGADVLSNGNAAAPQARTVVYDRVGRPELAARVRRMLGCPSAETATQIDAKRLVDVSIVLSDDCL